MSGYVALGLILVMFVISFFTKRIQSWRGMPYLYCAFFLFFLVNVMMSRERMYPSLIFMILALGFAIKSFRQRRKFKTSGR